MRRLAALLLSLALLPLGASEPIFRIKVTMTGRSGDASFSSSLEIGYAPCAIWTGGSGGGTGSPAETLEKAGGLAGLHKGGSLPFYAKTYNGSANGSDGSSADVMTLGPGIARWKERDKYNASERQTDATDRPDHRQAVRFTRTATGARITDFDLGVVSAGLGGYIGCANPYGMEIDGQLVVKFCSFEITNEELANWKHLNKTKSQTFTDVNGSVSVTAQLYVELEDPGEVDVEIEGYDSWIPTGNLDSEAKPGNTIRVKAKVHATGEPGMEADRKARIFFELVKVGEEPGVCANWPTHPAEKGYDLRILQPENAHLELITKDLKFKTKNLVKEGKLTISAFDFAAWGVLKVTAEDKDGKALKVTYHGKALSSIQLPKDEDRNHIADAWQEAKGVQGFSADWDAAEVVGQDAKGDGVSLFQKYRGFVVSSGQGRNHLRLEPKEKVHFVVDPSGVFDFQGWFTASGIRALRLNEGQYRREGRVVDFNGKNAKFAVRLETDDDPGGFAAQYAVTNMAGSPRVANQVKLFRGRMNAMLSRVIARIQKAVAAPNSPEGAEEAAILQNACGMSLQEAAAALKQVDQGQLLERLVRLAALHEMGHACGISDGHVKAAVKDGKDDQGKPTQWVEYDETDEQVGDVLCPMQYLDQVARRRFILLGVLGGSGTFCKDGFECYRNLTVK